MCGITSLELPAVSVTLSDTPSSDGVTRTITPRVR
jgi:hypothetical protein